MEPKSDAKEFKYDYFVNKDNKMCPQNSEFKPEKVTDPKTLAPEKKSPGNVSAWNSVGTWEEKKVDGAKFLAFMEQNKGFLSRTVEFA